MLSRMEGEDAHLAGGALDQAAKAVECIVTEGADKAMNLYNISTRKKSGKAVEPGQNS